MDPIYSKNRILPKHGGDIEGFAKAAGCLPEEVVDFSSNINPLGLSKKLQNVYQASVSDLTFYPDPLARKMCRTVAARHHLNADNVIAGNGSMALIDLAIRSLKPKRALLIEPCFNEYRRLLRLSNADVDHILLKPDDDFQFPFEEICKKLPEIDLLIIGHPNNPTGSSLNPEQLIRLMEIVERKGKSILIDEAFIDWREHGSVIRHIPRRSRAVVVRSLTKFYSLAGIRAGYACAGKAMIERMRAFQETWNCNGIAQSLAVAALSDKEFQIKSRQWFDEESRFMFESLKKIPSLKVFPGRANFFLCRMTDPIKQEYFWRSMMRSGIYLREVSDFIGLDRGFFRLALKSRKENGVLLRAIQESLGGIKKNNDRVIFSVHS